jgi:hypothetical protein
LSKEYFWPLFYVCIAFTVSFLIIGSAVHIWQKSYFKARNIVLAICYTLLTAQILYYGLICFGMNPDEQIFNEARQLNALNEISYDEQSFFRVLDKSMVFSSPNANLMTHNNALSHYSSTTEEASLILLKKLGYATRTVNIMDTGGTLFSDCLLSGGYILTGSPLDDDAYVLYATVEAANGGEEANGGEAANNTQNENAEHNTRAGYSAHYAEATDGMTAANNVYIYRSVASPPCGFIINSLRINGFPGLTDNPIINQNEIARTLTGQDLFTNYDFFTGMDDYVINGILKLQPNDGTNGAFSIFQTHKASSMPALSDAVSQSSLNNAVSLSQPPDGAASISRVIEVNGRQRLYLNAILDTGRFTEVRVNGHPVRTQVTSEEIIGWYNPTGYAYPCTYMNGLLYLGEFDGGEVTVSLLFDGMIRAKVLQAAALDMDEFSVLTKPGTALAVNAAGNRLIIEANNENDGDTLFLPFAYHAQWRGTINGEAVRPQNILGGFLGVDLANGQNHIELTYIPAYFITGILICVCTLIFICCFAAFRKKIILTKLYLKAQAFTYIIFYAAAAFAVLFIYILPIFFCIKNIISEL